MALTHYRAGRFYYGDEYGREACLRLNRIYSYPKYDIMKIYLGLIESNTDNDTFISLYPRENETLDIVKFKETFTSVGLNDTITTNAYQNIEKTSIDISEFRGDDYYSYESCFYDGKDGYWYGFYAANQRDNVKLNRVKIKKEDYSTITDTWTINNVNLYKLGQYSRTESDYPYRMICSIIKNGYLYAMSNNKTEIYKINVNNPVDITKIELGFKSNFSDGRYTYNYFYNWGNYILGYDFTINANDEVIKSRGKKLSLEMMKKQESLRN